MDCFLGMFVAAPEYVGEELGGACVFDCACGLLICKAPFELSLCPFGDGGVV